MPLSPPKQYHTHTPLHSSISNPHGSRRIHYQPIQVGPTHCPPARAANEPGVPSREGGGAAQARRTGGALLGLWHLLLHGGEDHRARVHGEHVGEGRGAQQHDEQPHPDFSLGPPHR